ncbi:MAG: FG-GAP repeat domain-containing protein, partial [Halocynthiibacter sp.]
MRALAPIVCLAALVASPVAAQQGALSARYIEPTTRYDHGVLGDAVEYGALEIKVKNGRVIVRLQVNRVFEDIAPLIADVDGDGDNEVITVETDMARGAALAIYDETGKIVETPHIGQRYRWLAPTGAADLDGDGLIEIAYVDQPHLAKILRVWR